MAERFGKGNVDRIGGLWVLHLGGTSFERGLQHGTLMRYRVRDTIEFYRKLPSTLAARVAGESTYRLRALERLKRTLVRQLAKNRDSDALEEMRGLAVGLGMRVEELAEVDVDRPGGGLRRRMSPRASAPWRSGAGGRALPRCPGSDAPARYARRPTGRCCSAGTSTSGVPVTGTPTRR